MQTGITTAPPVYIDAREAARITTLSVRTLAALRAKGSGPRFARLGGRVVYKLTDVVNWIESRTTGGKS